MAPTPDGHGASRARGGHLNPVAFVGILVNQSMRGSEGGGGSASGAWSASGDWSGANCHAMATAAPDGGQRIRPTPSAGPPWRRCQAAARPERCSLVRQTRCPWRAGASPGEEHLTLGAWDALASPGHAKPRTRGLPSVALDTPERHQCTVGTPWWYGEQPSLRWRRQSFLGYRCSVP